MQNEYEQLQVQIKLDFEDKNNRINNSTKKLLDETRRSYWNSAAISSTPAPKKCNVFVRDLCIISAIIEIENTDENTEFNKVSIIESEGDGEADEESDMDMADKSKKFFDLSAISILAL